MSRVSRKSASSLLAVFAAFALFAVITPTPLAHAAGVDARARVLAKLDDDWSAAAATKDADKVASFYTEDAVVYPPNEPVAVGREAAKKVWAAYFAMPNFSISWKTTTAELSKSGETGFTAGTFEDSFDGPDGKRVNEIGKYLCMWRKQKDGSWKAIHDMWNADAK